MKNSQATLKMVRRCRLNNMLARQVSRERERTRIYQIRREMSQNFKNIDSNGAIKD